MKKASRLLSYLFLILLSAGSLQAKEGFGMVKKLVTLQRTNPPEVLITGTRIQAIGKGQGRDDQEVAAQIATKLSSELVQHEPRLTLDAQRPQTIVEVTVLNNSFDSKWENRTGTRFEPTGKDSKGKMQYREVQVTLRYQVVSHRFSASYTVQDQGARKTLFADSMESSYSQDFQEGTMPRLKLTW